jgi:hypothetical protein
MLIEKIYWFAFHQSKIKSFFVLKLFKKKLKKLKLNFFYVFSYYFDVLMLKINLKNKNIYYFNIFINKKYLKSNFYYNNQKLKERHLCVCVGINYYYY